MSNNFKVHAETSAEYTVSIHFQPDGSDVKFYKIPVVQPRRLRGSELFKVSRFVQSHEEMALIASSKDLMDAQVKLEAMAKPTAEVKKELPKEKKEEDGKPKKRGRKPKSKPAADVSDDVKGQRGGEDGGDDGASADADAEGMGS